MYFTFRTENACLHSTAAYRFYTGLHVLSQKIKNSSILMLHAIRQSAQFAKCAVQF